MEKTNDSLIEAYICNKEEMIVCLEVIRAIQKNISDCESQSFEDETERKNCLKDKKSLLINQYQYCRETCTFLISEQKQYQQRILES